MAYSKYKTGIHHVSEFVPQKSGARFSNYCFTENQTPPYCFQFKASKTQHNAYGLIGTHERTFYMFQAKPPGSQQPFNHLMWFDKNGCRGFIQIDNKKYEEIFKRIESFRAGNEKNGNEISIEDTQTNKTFKISNIRPAPCEQTSIIFNGEQPVAIGKVSNEANERRPLQCNKFLIQEKTNEEGQAKASGLKWRKVNGAEPTEGTKLVNAALSDALRGKNDFSQAEWDEFNVKDLRFDHFIQAGASYFQPAAKVYPHGIAAVTDAEMKENFEFLKEQYMKIFEKEKQDALLNKTTTEDLKKKPKKNTKKTTLKTK